LIKSRGQVVNKIKSAVGSVDFVYDLSQTRDLSKNLRTLKLMKDHSEYQELLSKYKAVDIAKKHLLKIEQRIVAGQSTLELLDRVVEKEYKDVELLEKKSLQSIFQKILGSNKNLEKEKQEYLHAVLQYNECLKSLELLEYEKSILLETIKENAQAEERLQQIIQDQKAEIFRDYPLKGEYFFVLDKQLRDALNEEQTIKASLHITERLLIMIKQMITLLSSAKHNGAWGENPTHAQATKRIKNENIDKAQILSYKIKQMLQELEDLSALLSIFEKTQVQQIQISKQFNDMYYTELISDWIIHSKIVASINYLEKVTNSIKKLNTQFIYKKQQCEEKTKELDQEKRKLILDL